jgi:hypothetical protein
MAHIRFFSRACGGRNAEAGKTKVRTHAWTGCLKAGQRTGATMNTRIETMKTHARRLRGTLAEAGTKISHAEALELVARQHGHRDWNTAHAAATAEPPAPPVALQEKVAGRYLGQPFRGTVIALKTIGSAQRWMVTLHLDEPVDVVTFDSFSALRTRITGTIGPDGKTVEKTSNGEPHLVIVR